MSADNQQERLSNYISGFVDGEGSFHIAIQKSPNLKFGYQLLPEFHVSQSADRDTVLKLIKDLWKCGYIKANFPGRDNNLVFVVRNRLDLLNKVIPFFREYPLLSDKQKDFEKFAYIVEEMHKGNHLNKKHFIKMIRLAFSMNGLGKYRKLNKNEILDYLESSETIR
jgi:hypothetical protein